MKLTISALAFLGLSQVCSAESYFDVDFRVPLEGIASYSFCTTIVGCTYMCASMSSEGSITYSYPTDFGHCRLPSGGPFPTVAGFFDSSNSNSLGYMMFTGDSKHYDCTAYKETNEGALYRCSLPSLFDTTTTSTTTTTATSSATSSTATSSTATTTALPVPACSNKDTIFAKKRGNGYNGDCCKTEADCMDECIKGKCNGPKKSTATIKKSTTTTATTKKPSTTTTIKKSTTVTKKSTQTPAACKSGYLGKKKGNGLKGACCTTSWDFDCFRSLHCSFSFLLCIIFILYLTYRKPTLL
ncbi:hypothetical protein BD560DRAFT_406209 [Blakeslea trispora]|nr:hypothetical protein BD560DRAFT_406209 [Blakeslea trispora]